MQNFFFFNDWRYCFSQCSMKISKMVTSDWLVKDSKII